MFTSAMSVITVDIAGPFLLKVHSHSKQKMKYYVLICVCAATGLIQYLLQEDLTPRAFLNCVAILKSRFGPIRKISLDPAGCFIAAEKAVNNSQNKFGDEADFMSDSMGIVADAAQKEGFVIVSSPPKSSHWQSQSELGVSNLKEFLYFQQKFYFQPTPGFIPISAPSTSRQF